mmetsp:Transcript_5556/g.13537  ORF Transcript_5556/g.13537 Transcript_5556/m.13537 type:complete len:264 (-) Transcript_5556:908-1699(-)
MHTVGSSTTPQNCTMLRCGRSVAKRRASARSSSSSAPPMSCSCFTATSMLRQRPRYTTPALPAPIRSASSILVASRTCAASAASSSAALRPPPMALAVAAVDAVPLGVGDAWWRSAPPSRSSTSSSEASSSASWRHFDTAATLRDTARMMSTQHVATNKQPNTPTSAYSTSGSGSSSGRLTAVAVVVVVAVVAVVVLGVTVEFLPSSPVPKWHDAGHVPATHVMALPSFSLLHFDERHLHVLTKFTGLPLRHSPIIMLHDRST